MDQENIESKALGIELGIKIESPAQKKIGEKNTTESVSDTPSKGNEQDTSIVSLNKTYILQTSKKSLW